MNDEIEKAKKEYRKLIADCEKYLRQVFDYRDKYMVLHTKLWKEEKADTQEVLDLQNLAIEAKANLANTHLKLEKWRIKHAGIEV